ncbi:MAG: response regulator [Desulfobacterales bacterium]|nr:response regulator [Desulfobacterales bacterium]
MRNVLVVDDDRAMLSTLKKGLEKYGKSISVLTAEDGIIATEKLKTKMISLLVTDLKMPRMNGFHLLSHAREHYPEIPVMIITGYSTPEIERLTSEKGAVACFGKPFMIENLTDNILKILENQASGGNLGNVSPGIFLQLIEMEERTCTIRLMDEFSKNQGILFFKEGELYDARVNGFSGDRAAYEIFSWDKVTLSIENICFRKEKKIYSDLQSIFLEAMRLKDEANQSDESPETKAILEEDAETVEAETMPESLEIEESKVLDTIKVRLEKEMGARCGLEDIYRDNSWDDLIEKMKKVGTFFEAGQLRLGYINRDEKNDLIILPLKETALIAFNSKNPRDRIIQFLSNYYSQWI